jgi:hypothetical protein
MSRTIKIILLVFIAMCIVSTVWGAEKMEIYKAMIDSSGV